MSEEIVLHDFKNFGIITSGSEVYSFEVVGSEKLAQPGILPFYSNKRALLPMNIGKFQIVPNGEQNQMPEEIVAILDENNLSPGIIRKGAFMLSGQGPALYEYRFENGIRKKYWDTDPEIEKFLNDWDYEDFLQRKVIEFSTIHGHYTKYYRNRGVRVGGAPFIAKLEHVSSVFARLEWPDQYNFINNIIVGDYAQPWRYGLRAYPVFNKTDPFANPVSMRYNNLYSFGMDNSYSRPGWYGTISWIKLATSISKLLFNFNKNAAAIKYHIIVPALYWSIAEQELKDKAKYDNKAYHPNMLVKFKKKKFQEFADTQRGVENVGKFLTTESIWDDDSKKYVEWKIVVLDQKVKDFIDAQVNIAKQASLETTAGFGMHPSLSNISFDGNLPSGSELLYAFKLYLLTDVDIPESIVCRDINNAIAANFPKSKMKLGFYHDAVISEQETNPKDRIKNQSSGKPAAPGSSGTSDSSAMVKCSHCGNIFDYLGESEAGMGYVNCPDCDKPVTQKSAL